jgi:hypothetical protein
MTKVYTLNGRIIYEGSVVLGVYTSPEEAWEAERKWREDLETMNYDDYYIEEFVLNGNATH